VASGVNLLCIMAEPALRRSNYDIRMSAGCIAAAGTLGIIIPPSIMLIVLGPIVGVPVTSIFAAALIPGLVLSAIYLIYSIARCYFNPKLGPPLPKEMWPTNYFVVIRELIIGVVPLVILIGCVLGVILAGIATTTEAAACGSFGALVLITLYRRMTWALFKRALFKTALLAAMILVLIAACNFFGAVFARLGGATYLSNLLLGLEFSPWVMLIIILVSLFLIGWALEWIPLILVFVPLTLPAIQALGFDMLWYSVLVALVLQTSWMTPPVALSGYFIKGSLPHWDLMDIYRGMLQYVWCQWVGIIIFMIFPAIILWLPIYLGLWK
jgi:tripartite ATP-independent transporter DctM subunit